MFSFYEHLKYNMDLVILILSFLFADRRTLVKAHNPTFTKQMGCAIDSVNLFLLIFGNILLENASTKQE